MSTWKDSGPGLEHFLLLSKVHLHLCVAECTFGHFCWIMGTLVPLYCRHPTDSRQQCFTVIGNDDNGGIMTTLPKVDRDNHSFATS